MRFIPCVFAPFSSGISGGEDAGDPIGQDARPRRRRAWAATAAAISCASWKGRSASRAIRWARRWARFDGVVARGVGIGSVDPAGQGGAAGCLFAVDSSSFRIKSLFAADSSSFRRIKSLESAPRGPWAAGLLPHRKMESRLARSHGDEKDAVCGDGPAVRRPAVRLPCPAHLFRSRQRGVSGDGGRTNSIRIRRRTWGRTWQALVRRASRTRSPKSSASSRRFPRPRDIDREGVSRWAVSRWRHPPDRAEGGSDPPGCRTAAI